MADDGNENGDGDGDRMPAGSGGGTGESKGGGGGSSNNATVQQIPLPAVHPMFGESRALTVSVVRRGNTTYLRAYPSSGPNPSPFQVLARSAFGHAAMRAKGKSMDGLDLPPACYEVKKELKGKEFGRKHHWRKWESLF